MSKVSIIGSGNVGGSAALRLARSSSVDDVILVDSAPGLAAGTALDIAQCAALDGFDTRVSGTDRYDLTDHSDVVVVTAGLARRPGQSRLDLLAANARIVSEVVARAVERSPYAVLIVVTNPLDEMTHMAWRTSGFPPARVMGMAGVLDSARYRAFVGWELGIPPREVDAMTLGSHGDTMVPIHSQSRVGGRPLEELLSPTALDRVSRRTRDAGAEIVEILRRGSAFHAPGASVAVMVESVIEDRRRILPACVWLSGQYGIEGVFLGVPAVIGRRGVDEVAQLPLEPDELADLRAAASIVAHRCRDLERLPASA
jgi:malate dehydrogenase